jgi:ribonuclease HI
MASMATWDRHLASMRPFNMVLNTNTSLTGWGRALRDSSTTSVGWWHRRRQHINELELKAVLQALQAFQPMLSNHSILLCCNNVTAIAYVNKLGGRSATLNKTMCKILKWCEQHHTQLSAQHLPGLNNSRANRLSRLYLQHEWQLADHIFHSLNRHWGLHTINHTATTSNAHLPWFNSCFHELGSEAVNCLTQDWR